VANVVLPAGWTFTQVGTTLTLSTTNVIAPGGIVRFPAQITFSLEGATRIDARVAGGGEAVTTNNDASLPLSGAVVPVPMLSTGSLLSLIGLLTLLMLLALSGGQRRRAPRVT
jgi:hypothetical protein